MAVKQIIKKIRKGTIAKFVPTPSVIEETPSVEENVSKSKKQTKNNTSKKASDMTPEEITQIESLTQDINVPKQVKVLKKDKGLIERTESSKIVITDDNRQVLVD